MDMEREAKGDADEGRLEGRGRPGQPEGEDRPAPAEPLPPAEPEPPGPEGQSDDASPLETQDWTDETGRRWLKHLDQFEGMLAPIGAALLDLAGLAPGQRVIDVGCGAGPSTIVIARRVSPGGFALGLDLSPALIEAATQRASRPGAVPSDANVSFTLGDAATAELEEKPFDVLFSRFGLTFFEDPYRAFEHMRGWLAPQGRAVFSCWAPPEQNPWILELQAIVGRYVAAPEITPNAPGPFALADVARLNDILASAGFVDIEFNTWRGELPTAGPGSNPMRAAEFVMSGMHVGQMLGDAADKVKASVRRDIEAMFAHRQGPSGVTMPATTWLVSARNGGRSF